MRLQLFDSLTILVAVALFTKGFLLMKLEIGQLSTPCLKNTFDVPNVEGFCWNSTSDAIPYERVVILIIDALRYDFAFYQNENLSKLPFHNNMPVFSDLMKTKGCSKARLWRFIADAPTTTMQRIKGLTTGSLPTFIDVSKNFASSEITEDSIIDQFVASKRNITFMGDDTWMGLFPGRFNKAFPFPSFDVKDLHLVDNGILEHLLPELKSNDWQLLIAHFLGVDHCGHRYGPYHPEMPLKLRQMNEVVKDVVEMIDKGTLLLVMGDHGMTPTGDHGGETFNEIHAALFAYSPKGGFEDCNGEGVDAQQKTVNQVDIVPTISLLLGTAIPFANLGVVIDEMLPGTTAKDRSKNLQEAMSINARQIHEYITAYQEVTNSLPQDAFQKLNQQYKDLTYVDDTDKQQMVLKYMKSAKEMFQMVWAKFNIALMVNGITVLTSWLAVKAKSYYTNSSSNFTLILYGIPLICFISTIYASMTTSFINDILSVLILCLSATLLSFLVLSMLWCTNWNLLNVCQLLPILFLALFSVSCTSNSFILNEDTMAMFLWCSCVVCICIIIIFQSADTISSEFNSLNDNRAQSSKPAHHRNDFHMTRRFITVLLYSFVAVLCSRFAFLFRSCRAEQFWCFNEVDDAGVGTNYEYIVITATSSFCSAMFGAYAFYSQPKRHGIESMFLYNILSLASALCGLSFIVTLLPAEILDEGPEWLPTVLPRCIYAILIMFFIYNWINPVRSSGKLSKSLLTKAKERPIATNDVNCSMRNHVVTSTLGLCVLFCLLLGPALATAIPLWISSVYCILQLISLQCLKTKSCLVPFSCVVVWNILFSFWWFATGHQASISSIRWDAAFVGFQGNHVTNIIPAILLLLDTFSMQILSSVSLPLLAYWAADKSSDGGSTTADFSHEHDQTKILNDLFQKHLCFHVVKTIGCMLAACIHRRHLMVWWIFAPRYLFEGVSIIIVIFASLLSYVNVWNGRRKFKISSVALKVH